MKSSAGSAARAICVLLLAAGRMAAQTAAVEGKVIDSVSGRPVPNAVVWLLGTARSGNPPDRDNYRTLTDTQGRFAIQGVVPGRYTTASTPEGYVCRIPGLPADPSLTPDVVLEPGRPATIELRVIPTGVISGRVVDPQGDPVRGAFISAKQYDYSTGRKQLAVRGTAVRTNDRGEYRIFRLPPGSYYVLMDGISGRGTEGMPAEEIRGTLPPLGLGTTYHPDASDPSRARQVEVTPGAEVRNVEIRVRPENLFSVRGPRPGPPGDLQYVFIQPRFIDNSDRARLTSDGFEFKGLLPGSYIISALQKDPAHPDQSQYARQFVDIVDRDVEGVALTFSAGAVISGTVKVAGGELPSPPARIAVRLQVDAPPAGMPSNMQAPTATATPDGAFVLRGILPEVYRLSAVVSRGTYVKAVQVGDRELPDFRIDFSKVSGSLTLLLGTDGAGVEGVVKNPEGEPVKSAMVTLVPAGSQQQLPERLRIASTDAQGHFTLRDIAPGEYHLFSWRNTPPGAPLDPDFRERYVKLATPMKLAPNARETVELKVISW